MFERALHRSAQDDPKIEGAQRRQDRREKHFDDQIAFAEKGESDEEQVREKVAMLVMLREEIVKRYGVGMGLCEQRRQGEFIGKRDVDSVPLDELEQIKAREEDENDQAPATHDGLLTISG